MKILKPFEVWSVGYRLIPVTEFCNVFYILPHHSLVVHSMVRRGFKTYNIINPTTKVHSFIIDIEYADENF